MDAQIEKKMDIKDSINQNLEDSAVAALTLLRSGRVLDNMKAMEVEDPNPASTPQCAGTFSQTTAEQIIDTTLLGFNCHTVTPGSSPKHTFIKPQFATMERREVTCCWLQIPESSLSLLLV